MTILPGVNIGNNVVAVARAAVTKDMPDNCVVVSASAGYIKGIWNDVES